ncbi:MAG: hypothetical protein J2P20_15855 [Pseudonocardia sp.]|nr:hypothetical protein [Pseudonocardia sp.]MBO0875706.1 hypothetical protein [Pseudonocardia sp.]
MTGAGPLAARVAARGRGPPAWSTGSRLACAFCQNGRVSVTLAFGAVTVAVQARPRGEA